MPSVVGLLEQHELTGRRRVDGLREEADPIQAELAAAELEWQGWVIARRRVDTVLAPDGGGPAGTEITPDPQDADMRPRVESRLDLRLPDGVGAVDVQGRQIRGEPVMLRQKICRPTHPLS
ncbi:hypothetical protein [Streptomyces sp. NPDC088178]|uniref:hypothetical protein n=1 Tax=Streptomyces sp. NPDC088178 TaxID=3365836 RepID=UPI0038058A91